MDGPGSQQRVVVALVLIALAAVGVWATMEPGMYRNLAWLLLGFFAFRVWITRMRVVRGSSDFWRRLDYETSGDAERQNLLKSAPGGKGRWSSRKDSSKSIDDFRK